jgi:hypothetical protein
MSQSGFPLTLVSRIRGTGSAPPAPVTGRGGPGHPYALSLPVRTLDPQLTLLTRTLKDSDRAPTWVVRWDDPHAWGLDPRDHVEHALHAHYKEVAVIYGHPVWLHRGINRFLGTLPTGCASSYVAGGTFQGDAR